MKIRKILSQYRNDFTAMMECEHCGHTEKLTSGYADDFYHQRVIPALHCTACGKDRAGEVEQTDAGMP
jgi:transcription elongation factor Elf1